MATIHMKNFSYSLLSSLIPILTNLACIPIYLQAVGIARFGIISLVWLVFGYFGLFDFGLSKSTSRKLASLPNIDRNQRNTIILTSLSISLIIGIMISFIFHLLAVGYIAYFPISDGGLRKEVEDSLKYITVLFPITMLSSVLIGVFEARNRFLAINSMQLVTAMLMQVLPLVMVFAFEATVGNAILGVVISRTLFFFMLIASSDIFADFRSVEKFNLKIAQELFQYGSSIAVSNIISPILVSLDQIMIGSLVGAAQVAVYSIPFGMVMKSLIIPAAWTRVLFPKIAGGTNSDAVSVTEKALAALAALMAVVTLSAMLAGSYFFHLWLADKLPEESYIISNILCIGVWLNSVGYVCFTYLQARGRAGVVAKLHILELPFFVLALYVLVFYFGPVGAAIAWTLRTLVDTTALIYFCALGKQILIFLTALLIIILGYFAAIELFNNFFIKSVFIVISLILVAAASLTFSYINQYPEIAKFLKRPLI